MTLEQEIKLAAKHAAQEVFEEGYKKASENEDLILTTGKQDFLQTYIIAKKCFNELEKICIQEFHYTDIVIYCNWTDRRRRDIYYHFLSKKGYKYGRDLENKKCIYKKFKKKES